jgi:hypothetical protein
MLKRHWVEQGDLMTQMAQPQAKRIRASDDQPKRRSQAKMWLRIRVMRFVTQNRYKFAKRIFHIMPGS